MRTAWHRRAMAGVTMAALVLVGCGSNDDGASDASLTDASYFDLTDDTATEPGLDGALADATFDTTPPNCSWVLADAGAAVDAPEVTPLQAWCTKGATNPAGCPSSPPLAGGPCSPSALQCVYDSSSGFLDIFQCDSKAAVWTRGGAACTGSCTSSDGGTPVADAPPCGSLPDIECQDTPYGTDFIRALVRFDAIASCCGGLVENTVTVSLQDGCASTIAFGRKSWDTDRMTQCLMAVIAGRRFRCAPAGTCLQRVWSTLK